MPNWRTMVEKDFLGAWDMTDAAGKQRDYTLTIESVKSTLVKTRETPKGKRKVVARFVGARKAMVVNTTNCETIESLYGPNTDDWIGKRVTLYATLVKSPKGGQVMGLRIRPAVPKGPAETIADKPVDEGMRAAQNEAFDRGDDPDAY